MMKKEEEQQKKKKYDEYMMNIKLPLLKIFHVSSFPIQRSPFDDKEQLCAFH